MLSLISLVSLVLPTVLGLYYNNSQDYTNGALGEYPSVGYHSSNITPPAWNFGQYPSSQPQPGYILFAPRGQPVPSEQLGPMIFDWQGELVWSGASIAGQTMSYYITEYQSKSVIAVWTGSFNGGGYGDGYGLILDDTYKVIATVNNTLGEQNDFHEFAITPNNTALITVYSKLQYDLSSLGVQATDGSTGWLLQGQFQEIDISTGQALFSWASIDHVPINMSYADPGTTGTSQDNAWDYFHINSIDKDADGNYLISSRHCHTLYLISKDDGHIMWEMNGKNSSFNMGNGTTYEWQHDARWQSNYTQISVFDNAATAFSTDESQARGLLINFDTTNMSTSLALEALPPTHLPSQSQGSFTLQPNGNWLAGWGQQPYFSEYDSQGNELWSVEFGLNSTQAYRVYRSNWTAYPTTNPNVSMTTGNDSNYDIYVSWNGATEVANWTVAGTSATDGTGLAGLNTTAKSGFETYISISQSAVNNFQYIQVIGLDSSNKTLGYSNFMNKDGSSAGSPASVESSSASSAATSSQTSSAQSSGTGSDNTVRTSGAATLTTASTNFMPALLGVLGAIAGSAIVL